MKIAVRTESTDAGVHYWTNWLKCQRYAWLSEAQKAARKEGSPLNREGLLSGIDAFDIGSIVHGILAAHYSYPAERAARFDTRSFNYFLDTGAPLDLDAHQESVTEAERLYRAYRAHWPPDDLGKILAVEKELALRLEAQEVSGGLDLVVRLSARDVKRLAKEIPGLEKPGVYIVDHKARGARQDAMQYEVDLHDPQFTLYPALWEANYPKDEVQGSIVNVLHKDKGQPTFKRHLIPKLAIKSEWPIVKGSLALGYRSKLEALASIESGGLPTANTGQCFKFGFKGWEACQFYKNNLCDRRQRTGKRGE